MICTSILLVLSRLILDGRRGFLDRAESHVLVSRVEGPRSSGGGLIRASGSNELGCTPGLRFAGIVEVGFSQTGRIELGRRLGPLQRQSTTPWRSHRGRPVHAVTPELGSRCSSLSGPSRGRRDTSASRASATQIGKPGSATDYQPFAVVGEKRCRSCRIARVAKATDTSTATRARIFSTDESPLMERHPWNDGRCQLCPGGGSPSTFGSRSAGLTASPAGCPCAHRCTQPFMVPSAMSRLESVRVPTGSSSRTTGRLTSPSPIAI